LKTKKLYNKAHNPAKRETEPYIEGSKVTFVTAQNPTKRAGKHDPTKRATTQYNKNTTPN
jgi:hypothetical protein